MRGKAKSLERMFSERRTALRRKRRLQIFLFIALILISVGTVLGWQQALAAELAPAEAGAGQLLLKDKMGGYRRALSLDSRADFTVSGMIASVNVSQTFHNNSDNWAEAVYVFPLPEQAAVRAMRIRIGERVIEGEIHERAEAKKIYQKARAEGRRAGLVEQERPNMFTTSVANIPPREQIIVELQYVQSVKYDAGEFSLRFPMTITPRYIPGDPLMEDNSEAAYRVTGEGWAFATEQVPDAARINPYQHPIPANKNNPVNPITITADINAGMPLANLDSPWHEVKVSRQDDRYHLELADGPVSMNRDFELRWRPASDQQPQAAVFTETVKDQHYALLMLLPPAKAAADKLLQREMIFVIDTSGSMGGVTIEQARQGLLLALDRLRPGDRFNVIEFNSSPRALYNTSQQATADRVQQAGRFVSGLKAHGGTEMRSALELALADQSESEHLRQVIFMTDGAVGNEAVLFKLIQKQLGDSRLFTVGIGSAPNSYFMRKAAQFGRGTFTYISAATEVRQRMNELFSKLEAPVAGDLDIQWSGDAQVEAYPRRIPDLYRGEPLMLAARLPDFNGKVVVSGRTADQRWQRELALDSHRNSSGIASVWARSKIESLLDEKRAGRADSEVRDAVIEVALRHRLVSPYTSFVAVDKTPVRAAEDTLQKESIANARPEGQSDQPYAWPATATDSRWQMLIGGLLLLLALLFHVAAPGSSRGQRHGF